MSIIIGASRIEQLEQNLAATALTLDEDDIARLDEVSALPPEYPGWMVERQGAGRRPAPFEAKA
jgi:diketogulonate reductase-like aldo/keto reductase